MFQRKSLLLVLALIAIAVFISLRSAKKEKQKVANSPQVKEVTPEPDKMENLTTEEKETIKSKISSHQGFPTPDEKCFYTFPDKSGVNLQDPSFSKILQGHAPEGNMFITKAVMKENNITMTYKDSTCNGWHVELTLAPYMLEGTPRDIANEFANLSASSLFTDRGQHLLIPLRSFLRWVPADKPFTDGEITWSCGGIWDCVLTRKNDAVTFSYSRRERIKVLEKIDAHWKKLNPETKK